MISRRELRLLKTGDIPYIPLPDGYQLANNEYGQIFLSRGGKKKKYYLTDAFLITLSGNRRDIDQIKLIVNIINSLEGIAKRLRLKSNTRIKIEDLVSDIRKNIG